MHAIGAAKGATGWWLEESVLGRSAEPMSRSTPVGIRGYTYSADAALAWLRDGTLPKQEG